MGYLSFTESQKDLLDDAFAVAPAEPQDQRAFVTIYESDRIVWQGTEGQEPVEYRQDAFDFEG